MLSLDHEYLKALLVRIGLLEKRCEKLEGATHTPQSVVDQLKQQLAEEISRSIKSQNERDEWKRKYEERLKTNEIDWRNEFQAACCERDEALVECYNVKEQRDKLREAYDRMKVSRDYWRDQYDGGR